MKKKVIRINYKKVAVTILLFFYPVISLFSKDIDLDKIYIKENSIYYKKLLDKKMDVHLAINSLFIDRNVIFADWVNGKKIIYIKEFPGINIVYSYDLSHHRREEILKLSGTITYGLMSKNGKYYFIKRFKANTGSIKGETVVLNINTKKVIILTSPNLFLDFSLSPDGNTILYEERRGIIEHFPVSNYKKLICRKIVYSDISTPNATTLVYLSPNRLKKLIINGSGGFYNSKIITRKKAWKINGITSSTEVCWLNNRYFVYRTGGPGNYSLKMYDTLRRRSKTLVKNSLNTNLHYSSHAGILSFLKNQIVHIYKISERRIVNIGIEGEDISFSPDGNRFTSLLLKKLFITNYHTIEKQSTKLKRNSKKILEIYKKLANKKSDWANEYTYQYLKKKIAEYNKLTGR